ncbi:spondin domain-containing protein [Tamlana sp. 2201CG12-4]|uniref:T9SS type A sorting domain-containing protein n=1 Tax=Tamlana sp. 2201CG12-4 TaxID=3112582 RepID=UPI002DB83A60|nr:spondin domain-containing protein [Tamlana sp. 2201CG12-4]MEC3907392.1 spondin domain-containing protein [Tamlana sp. 2201CG12-4]
MKNFTLLFTLLLNSLVFSQSTATYTIVFESFWETPAADPVNGISTIAMPDSPHWSPLAIATHKTVNSILEMNTMASTGIENIAETGSTSAFESEVTANADADKFVIGSGLGAAQGTISQNIDISEAYPLVSLATMIAPSPDWFIAVNSENLRSGNNAVNNGWKASYTIDVFPYDAGTEDGSGYSISNPATNPQGVISSLSNMSPFDGTNSSMSHRIGTVTFNYESSTLSNEDTEPLEKVTLFPNPAQDNVTIANIQNLQLNSIEIYNILGEMVKVIQVEAGINSINIDLKTLNKGIYLFQLKHFNGISKTQKLVIQ